MNKKINVLFVFGTRPEAIKMAPLIKTLQSDNNFKVSIAVTGQHKEMLQQVLDFFNIQPDFDLKLMKSNQKLHDIAAAIIIGIRDIIDNVKPEIVLVHGDTLTSTAAALSSFYSNIDIGHVEAGLRTNNILSPWPEEANRQLTSRIATLNFAPTKKNQFDLINENIDLNSVVVTGNTVIDALKWTLENINSTPAIENKIANDLRDFGLKINIKSSNYILITGHRRENFGKTFDNICNAIKSLALKYPDFNFIYPVHLNPNVKKPVFKHLSGVPNIHLLNPVRYEHFVYLMQNSFLIMTDSGGIQEEAPYLEKPVVVFRETTERSESIEAGTVKLCGTEQENIIKSVSELIDNNELYKKMSQSKNPYGDGFASQKIKQSIVDKYNHE